MMNYQNIMPNHNNHIPIQLWRFAKHLTNNGKPKAGKKTFQETHNRM